MEGLEKRTAFSEYVARQLRREVFTLIDVGCRDGIDPGWRIWNDRLRAYGFDPNIEECKRISAREENPNVRYIPAFVAIPPEHPFARKKAGRPHCARNPWDRLSTARSLDIIVSGTGPLSAQSKTDLNLWQNTALADANKPIYLVEFFANNHIDDVDFVKIDVDGADFEILSSLESRFESHKIIGVGIEVNYIGSECDTDHTFHNTDRFLRSQGFDLFGLTVRRYSNRSLPSRYLGSLPAQTAFGRPLQGDAVYLRDLASPEAASAAANLSSEKLLKLAAVFSLFQVPDCAAEILLHFRDRVAEVIDVDSGLDLLAVQAQVDLGRRLSYRKYMQAFEANDRMFYRRTLWPLWESPRLVRKGLRLVRERFFG